ncbi:MAG: family metallopeptidase [Thermomicrobiales bacterium]|jgi:Xaa-Pro aminopeptidase|nr:family metallopeptidase [Thermomicrobiales bacterium]
MFDQPFDRDEYLARVARVREEMARLGLDGLLLTSGPNLTYLTGYPSPSRAGSRPFIFLLPQSGPPILIVHTGREREARGYSWVEEIRTYHALSRAPLSEIIEALHDVGLLQGRVGAELGAEESLDVPVGDFLELRQRLPGVRFADAGPALWPARMRKSAAEITCVREACTATARAYALTFEQARVGITEADVARLMTVASLEAGGGSPWVIITSGAGNYDLASKLPSRRRLEPGDFVWMDSGCTAGGYWSDFGRAGVVGGPTAEQRDAQNRIHDITMLGVDAVRPGITTSEVARRCNEALARLDLPITSCVSDLAARVGHGLGLMPTELPHVAEDDETVLEPGMIVTVEPGVATPFGIFHIEENVLVTEQGHEVLSHAPRELATIALT